MKALKRIDDGLARGEAALAALVLLSMILVAATQALLFNIAERDVEWAHLALEQISWVDQYLQKGTLWLAFLGASLATHGDKHIGIDVLSKILPRRAAALLKGVVGLGAAAVAFFLGRVFFYAVLNSAAERPLEYEVLGASGASHVCDASARALADAAMSRPEVFCGARWLLATIGAPVETPAGAFQLIVPAALLVISVRLLGKGIGAFVALARGEAEGTHGQPEP